MLRVVNKTLFDQYLEELRFKSRQKVKLLREKDVIISEEAQKLLDDIGDDDTDFLYRRLTRQAEVAKHDWQVPSTTKVRFNG